eukprot:Amastigsp_a676608_184.p3 type:complete len:200 gc:universal Amastigsp_a676608_184:625-26(-)
MNARAMSSHSWTPCSGCRRATSQFSTARTLTLEGAPTSSQALSRGPSKNSSLRGSVLRSASRAASRAEPAFAPHFVAIRSKRRQWRARRTRSEASGSSRAKPPRVGVAMATSTLCTIVARVACCTLMIKESGIPRDAARERSCPRSHSSFALKLNVSRPPSPRRTAIVSPSSSSFRFFMRGREERNGNSRDRVEWMNQK